MKIMSTFVLITFDDTGGVQCSNVTGNAPNILIIDNDPDVVQMRIMAPHILIT